MKSIWYHLPVALGFFLVLNLFVTNRAVARETLVNITLLAPILWIGLYVIASAPASKKR